MSYDMHDIDRYDPKLHAFKEAFTEDLSAPALRLIWHSVIMYADKCEKDIKKYLNNEKSGPMHRAPIEDEDLVFLMSQHAMISEVLTNYKGAAERLNLPTMTG